MSYPDSIAFIYYVNANYISIKMNILVATKAHTGYAKEISRMIEAAAKARGTGISKRDPDYISRKMEEGRAIIALYEAEVCGFCYIETWDDGKYIANSGLVVDERFRQQGLATLIKKAAFRLSRKKYPDAKLFGITTSSTVMRINADLGYRPVSFSEFTIEDKFWEGCQSCPNYDILTRNQRKNCLCTAMLFDPNGKQMTKEEQEQSRILLTE